MRNARENKRRDTKHVEQIVKPTDTVDISLIIMDADCRHSTYLPTLNTNWVEDSDACAWIILFNIRGWVKSAHIRCDAMRTVQWCAPPSLHLLAYANWCVLRRVCLVCRSPECVCIYAMCALVRPDRASDRPTDRLCVDNHSTNLYTHSFRWRKIRDSSLVNRHRVSGPVRKPATKTRSPIQNAHSAVTRKLLCSFVRLADERLW